MSDRAKALIKLGGKSYLDVVSMPDCFHFQQDVGRLAGLQIGKKYQKVQAEQSKLALKTEQEAVPSESVPSEAVSSEASVEQITNTYKAYRAQSAQINKTIHPFDEQNNWSDGAKINKSLLQCVRSISHLAEGIGININLSKATKVLHQIPDIVKGIESWVTNSKAKIQHWLDHGLINEVEKQWYSSCLLPLMYWQCQLSRTKNSRSNPPLVQHYEAKVQQAKIATLEQAKTLNIALNRQEQLAEMAHQMANSFQRASSQVEGRNGYLAFIHHGHKGIPKQKMEALTVIHNFDTKRADGSTPAQRLFKTDFPDLFEFLCENVTGFKEPRKRKNKPLIISRLQC
ncbi:MAG: DUF6399 domain-containing protein [Bacteroidota bacterium]